MSALASKIIELRELLARKFPQPVATPLQDSLSTGIGVIDNALGGGLPKRAITELICTGKSMGGGTCIAALIKAVQASGKLLAMVDGADSFDTSGLSNEQLSAMLLVRCRNPDEPIIAADLLLRDGNLPLVVIDLMMCPAKQLRAIPSSAWYRLQRVAEGNGTTALVLTPFRSVASAACTLQFSRGFRLQALDVLTAKNVAAIRVKTLRARNGASSAHQFATPEFAIA